MTDNELLEALAAKFRAYATSPLADMEIHTEDQDAYSEPDGFVAVGWEWGGSMDWRGIGNTTVARDDKINITIRAATRRTANTDANRETVKTACQQIRDVIVDNLQISAGGDTARSAGGVRWEYKRAEEGQNRYWVADIYVTYRIPPEN